jgi:uncharacterized protein YjiS (DUF1127 family)
MPALTIFSCHAPGNAHISQRNMMCVDAARRQDGVRGPATRRKTMFITTLLAHLRAWLRYRETVRELSRLTNRELNDLGIRRSEIETIARAHAFS